MIVAKITCGTYCEIGQLDGTETVDDYGVSCTEVPMYYIGQDRHDAAHFHVCSAHKEVAIDLWKKHTSGWYM